MSEFLEDLAKEKGLHGWKCTLCGGNDTGIWALHRIQSVNSNIWSNLCMVEIPRNAIGHCSIFELFMNAILYNLDKGTIG